MRKIKKVEKTESPIEEKKPQGREEMFFFPNERKTIIASSKEEAEQKLKENK